MLMNIILLACFVPILPIIYFMLRNLVNRYYTADKGFNGNFPTKLK